MNARRVFFAAVVLTAMSTTISSINSVHAQSAQVKNDLSDVLVPASNTANKVQALLDEEPNQIAPLQSIELTDALDTAEPIKAPMVVIVDKDKHITHVMQEQDGNLVDVFTARNATGKASTPTPDGRVQVVDKRWDPIWTPPVSIDPAQKKVVGYSINKQNPLGVAWLGLSKGGIGLHGTCTPTSIGRNASHGCIRHKNEDAKKLYSLIPVGTPVYIVEKYSGTKLLAADVDYLNGVQETAKTPVVASVTPSHNRI